jgi:hypothetical protein
VARAGVPVVGRAARGGARSSSRRSRSPRAARRDPRRRRRVRPRRRLHAGAGPDAAVAGRRLGVAVAGHAVDVEVEVAPLEQLGADLLQVRVGPARGCTGSTSRSCACRRAPT